MSLHSSLNWLVSYAHIHLHQPTHLKIFSAYMCHEGWRFAYDHKKDIMNIFLSTTICVILRMVSTQQDQGVTMYTFTYISPQYSYHIHMIVPYSTYTLYHIYKWFREKKISMEEFWNWLVLYSYHDTQIHILYATSTAEQNFEIVQLSTWAHNLNGKVITFKLISEWKLILSHRKNKYHKHTFTFKSSLPVWEIYIERESDLD